MLGLLEEIVEGIGLGSHVDSLHHLSPLAMCPDLSREMGGFIHSGLYIELRALWNYDTGSYETK